MGRGRGRRDNELIGQTVRISQGPYKGKPPVFISVSVYMRTFLLITSFKLTTDQCDYISQVTSGW